jgi:hypothetical protein
MRIRNSDTKRTGMATVMSPAGFGTPGLSVSYPMSGDEVSFWTEKPMGFADFDGVWVRLTSIGAGLVFVGWEKQLLTFVGLGPLANGLDVGGWNVGAQLKLGGSVAMGPLRWDGGPPSDEYDEPGPTEEWVPSEVRTVSGDGTEVLFDTGRWDLDEIGLDRVRRFTDRIGARFAGSLLTP